MRRRIHVCKKDTLYTHSHIHTMRRRIHVSYVCVEGPCTHTLTHTHTQLHTHSRTHTHHLFDMLHIIHCTHLIYIIHTHTQPILYLTNYTLHTPPIFYITHTHTTYFIYYILYVFSARNNLCCQCVANVLPMCC
jgi:hypothetical protein